MRFHLRFRIAGDGQTYAYPIILRAVESSDAMTVGWAKLPYDALARVSSRFGGTPLSHPMRFRTRKLLVERMPAECEMGRTSKRASRRR